MKNNFKNLKNWLMMGILSAGLNANSESLDISQSNNTSRVTVNQSLTENRYSLLSSTNLIDWAEIANSHGSNLVFEIENSGQRGFYKTISTYEPVTPKVNEGYDLSYYLAQRGLGPGTTFSNNLPIVNYTTSNRNVTVTWEETYNKYGGSAYSVNAPFSQTLTPGTNSVTFVFVWQCNDGGARVEGNVHID